LAGLGKCQVVGLSFDLGPLSISVQLIQLQPCIDSSSLTCVATHGSCRRGATWRMRDNVAHTSAVCLLSPLISRKTFPLDR